MSYYDSNRSVFNFPGGLNMQLPNGTSVRFHGFSNNSPTRNLYLQLPTASRAYRNLGQNAMGNAPKIIYHDNLRNESYQLNMNPNRLPIAVNKNNSLQTHSDISFNNFQPNRIIRIQTSPGVRFILKSNPYHYGSMENLSIQSGTTPISRNNRIYLTNNPSQSNVEQNQFSRRNLEQSKQTSKVSIKIPSYNTTEYTTNIDPENTSNNNTMDNFQSPFSSTMSIRSNEQTRNSHEDEICEPRRIPLQTTKMKLNEIQEDPPLSFQELLAKFSSLSQHSEKTESPLFSPKIANYRNVNSRSPISLKSMSESFTSEPSLNELSNLSKIICTANEIDQKEDKFQILSEISSPSETILSIDDDDDVNKLQEVKNTSSFQFSTISSLSSGSTSTSYTFSTIDSEYLDWMKMNVKEVSSESESFLFSDTLNKLTDDFQLAELIDMFNRNSFGWQIEWDKSNRNVLLGLCRVFINLTVPVKMSLSHITEMTENSLDYNSSGFPIKLVSFFLPRGTTQILQISSKTRIVDVVKSLLQHFKIQESDKNFALCEHTIENNTIFLKKLNCKEILMNVLLSWAKEAIITKDSEVFNRKRLVLQENENWEIDWKKFSPVELENFIKILNKEENEYRQAIIHYYGQMRKVIEMKMEEHLK